MIFREAKATDIEQIQMVRNAVLENVLSDPSKVTDQICLEYITKRGKGWVCEIDTIMVGFAIVDLIENSVWALFVHPKFEKNGIGRQLQTLMLDWYFDQATETIWLTTDQQTRAEQFYLKSGWVATGTVGNNEVKFEMTYNIWNDTANNNNNPST
jgi:GNAT superfamily N-acetyltransferase